MKKNMIFVLAIFLLSGCSNSVLLTETFPIMGAMATIKIPVGQKDAANAISKTKVRMFEIERIFNLYDTQSEIRNVNENAEKGDVRVSREFFAMLEKSFYINAITNGAFDITINPLVKLWGFYTKNKKQVPAKDEITAVLALTGMNKLLMDNANQSVRFLKPGVRLDMNAFVPGYSTGEAAKILSSLGIKNALIDGGGEIYCLGDNNGKPWKIGIQHPFRKNKTIATIELKNMACSTSGSYEKSFTVDGVTYSHIIDPRTGEPAKTDVVSVTVIANDSLLADALSTAFLVMKDDEVTNTASQLKNIEYVVIKSKNDKLEMNISKGLLEKYNFKKLGA